MSRLFAILSQWRRPSFRAADGAGIQPGFFIPRNPNPWFSFPGAQSATSYYDSAPLLKVEAAFSDL
jgi:NTE family protein